MKRPRAEVEARRDALAAMLRDEGYLPISRISERLGVSEPTLRRDLAALAHTNRITRTRGGALADQDPRFPTFAQRRSEFRDGKRRIAESALRLIMPGQTCFFDAGTTVAELAEALVRSPVPGLRVVTPSLPVAEILREAGQIEVFIPGGQLLPRQSVLLGSMAERALTEWQFDIGFFGIQGFNARGLWNTQEPVVRMQRVAARQAKRLIACADASKLGRDGSVFFCRWSAKVEIATDASVSDLRAASIACRMVSASL